MLRRWRREAGHFLFQEADITTRVNAVQEVDQAVYGPRVELGIKAKVIKNVLAIVAPGFEPGFLQTLE